MSDGNLESECKMQGKKILIIDDDSHLCQMVHLLLSAAGAEVFTAMDGRQGLKLFYAERPDLVLLDIRMPDLNGWETCQHIRVTSNTPIIMLTTLQEDEEIVRGLQHGADDFVTKPFSGDVLQARIEAVLRRAEQAMPTVQQYIYYDGHLSIDLEKRQVTVAGEAVRLTALEQKMLFYLAKHAGKPLSYEAILHHVWGADYTNSTEYVQVYMSTLRKKIEVDPRRPRYLQTEHGYGYSFVKETKRQPVLVGV